MFFQLLLHLYNCQKICLCRYKMSVGRSNMLYDSVVFGFIHTLILCFKKAKNINLWKCSGPKTDIFHKRCLYECHNYQTIQKMTAEKLPLHSMMRRNYMHLYHTEKGTMQNDWLHFEDYEYVLQKFPAIRTLKGCARWHCRFSLIGQNWLCCTLWPRHVHIDRISCKNVSESLMCTHSPYSGPTSVFNVVLISISSYCA